MTNLNKTVFVLTCVLIAFAYTGWEQFTYAMTPAQKRGWFITISLVVLAGLAWALRPLFIRWFF